MAFRAFKLMSDLRQDVPEISQNAPELEPLDKNFWLWTPDLTAKSAPTTYHNSELNMRAFTAEIMPGQLRRSVEVPVHEASRSLVRTRHCLPSR